MISDSSSNSLVRRSVRLSKTMAQSSSVHVLCLRFSLVISLSIGISRAVVVVSRAVVVVV